MDRVGAPPIFLLTDFGTRDAYVGQVKGVIAGIAPAAAIIDLTHEVEPFAIDEGAWLLETALPALPGRCVVLAVVDPGVGTARKPLVVRSGERLFVGPDNGLLSGALPALSRAAASGGGSVATPEQVAVYELCAPQFRRPHTSATFHGRDIFAPAAAHLANGVAPERFGPPVPELLALPPFCGEPGAFGELRGRVIHIDRFGNLVTTIRAAELFPSFELTVGDIAVDRRVHTFASAPDGLPFCHADSSGYIAIAINQESAADRLGVRRGDRVTVTAR